MNRTSCLLALAILAIVALAARAQYSVEQNEKGGYHFDSHGLGSVHYPALPLEYNRFFAWTAPPALP